MLLLIIADLIEAADPQQWLLRYFHVSQCSRKNQFSRKSILTSLVVYNEYVKYCFLVKMLQKLFKSVNI